ncbi:MAG: hypothetical protein HEQ23_02325 [Tepidisphaera sp.]
MIRTLALAVLSLAPTALADCGPFFFPPISFFTIPSFTSDLKAVDLDHDGVEEIITASSGTPGSTGVTVIRRNAAQTYTSIQFIPLPAPQTLVRFIIEDADGDGNLDLLAIEYAAGSVRVYRGVGDGTFLTASAAYSVGRTPTSLALSDLNGDQRPDLVVTNTSDDTISVLMGAAGGGFFPRTTYPAGDGPNLITLIDVDHDGRDDVLTTVSNPAGVNFFKGNGNGSFQARRVSAAANNNGLTSRVVQDINSDGIPDIIATNNTSGFLVFIGNPLGAFTCTVVSGPADLSTNALTVADFDMDGSPDVTAVASETGFNLRALVYLNRGAPAFAAPLDFGGAGVAGSNPLATLMDRNRDGLPDVLWADRTGQLCILETSGGGPVQILQRPDNQILAPGATAEFATSAVGVNLDYRWYKNGSPLLNSARISGADTRLLRIQNVEPADSAVYECRIATGCDTKPVSAFLAVQAPANPCPVDFNADGFLDFFDYADYVQAFEEGC